MDILPGTTTQSGPLFSYTIKCSQHGRVAIFLPQRQLISLVEGTSQHQVELGFSPSRLLELLIKKSNSIVARKEILDYAWPERVVTQNSLNQAISRLRELLGDEQDKQIIQTVPRRGYLFNASFLVATQELPVIDDDARGTQTVFAQETSSTLTWSSLPLGWQLPIRLLLVATTVLMLSSLVLRIDWDLLLQPDLAINTQQEKGQHLIYTAPNPALLETLKSDVSKLRERLVSLSNSPETLIFNRTQDYYDVICINQGIAKFMTIHHSQLSTINDQQLLSCLK
ncbi:transcriptional regulator [Pseudomonas sp. 6D_7.1_Bac1]|uniref:winged helix-turn-helix domain-containing protein n=1 Tax=Pseudomonas sp. 6D_7.1_Bac1 TaxID=2971615 RepID=UPI0021C81985|nr:winged helix-turn-helix domain-containing protein [Pseudomonas sp. 6D_7.1_Bac1]MCU1750246.1 winged helix-turn-helix domain-containing protein [Pseudomonas sp. 6D_7.1_Bac1]